MSPSKLIRSIERYSAYYPTSLSIQNFIDFGSGTVTHGKTLSITFGGMYVHFPTINLLP